MRILNRNFLTSKMSRAILIALLISISLPCRSDAETSPGPGSRHHLFFETGGLLGGETEVPQYVESFFRLYSEAGYEFETSQKGELPGNRFGLAVTGALGTDDMRVGISPRATLRLNPEWAIQGSAGPVWSSKEEEAGLFDQGWQVRGGLLYKDTASFTVLWQALPYSSQFEDYESGTQHSVYAGVMFHGKPGAIVSLVTWGLIVAVIGLVLITDPPS
jgi:hypothetical protein